MSLATLMCVVIAISETVELVDMYSCTRQLQLLAVVTVSFSASD